MLVVVTNISILSGRGRVNGHWERLDKGKGLETYCIHVV